jgi:hypothetical protein
MDMHLPDARSGVLSIHDESIRDSLRLGKTYRERNRLPSFRIAIEKCWRLKVTGRYAPVCLFENARQIGQRAPLRNSWETVWVDH